MTPKIRKRIHNRENKPQSDTHGDRKKKKKKTVTIHPVNCTTNCIILSSQVLSTYVGNLICLFKSFVRLIIFGGRKYVRGEVLNTGEEMVHKWMLLVQTEIVMVN